MKTVIVTGGTSGIGKESVISLRQAGYEVYEFSRRDINDSFHISVDVSDEKSVADAVKSVFDKSGRIDAVLCCAGFGISGAVEFTKLSDAKKQLDVNFFGTDNTVRSIIPYMRKQGFGRIVCVSSVAGALPIPFQTYYSVSKAAINAYVKALRSEVKRFGISVCAVMPGDISTGFTSARLKSAAGDDIYGGTIAKSVAGMEKDEKFGMSPKIAGNFLCRTVRRKNVKPLYTIGLKYKIFVIAAKLLPESFVNYVVGKLYA